MPELTLDHCGPLVKNLPVLGLVLLLWLAMKPARRQRRPRAGLAAHSWRMRAGAATFA